MATTTEFGIKPSGAITNVSSSPSSAEEASRESLCDTSWRDWLGDGYRSDFGTSTTYRSRSRFPSGGSIGWLRKSCLWEGAEWDILELVSSWEKISLSVSKVKGRSDLWRMSHKSLLVIYPSKLLIFRIEVFCMCLDCLLTHLISVWSIRELNPFTARVLESSQTLTRPSFLLVSKVVEWSWGQFNKTFTNVIYKLVYLTNRFHVTVSLFSNRSQMTRKMWQKQRSLQVCYWCFYHIWITIWIAPAKPFFEAFTCLMRNNLKNIFKATHHVEQNKENKFLLTSSMYLYSYMGSDQSQRSIHIIV